MAGRGWQVLRERLTLEYRRTVTDRSGKRLVVTARPRSMSGDPDEWPLPWPLVIGWIAMRQLILRVCRKPGWQVDVMPYWEPNRAWMVTRAPKADAIRTVDAEAERLVADRPESS